MQNGMEQNMEWNIEWNLWMEEMLKKDLHAVVLYIDIDIVGTDLTLTLPYTEQYKKTGVFLFAVEG